ncbi:GRIP and coiled-coil domain-containing protein 2-like [Anoplophora glabripennis]|uniref:GRIP and coiled-coil domain-containing protein 2-like n=1 Tax=Anoplophora glabripennis TaxID=217634 RepID=UPI00087579D4|nr:GRIP and coiled-coil domain-containing protein 2-like [Anoplophora glabripennis]
MIIPQSPYRPDPCDLEYADVDYKSYGPINYKAASIYAAMKRNKNNNKMEEDRHVKDKTKSNEIKSHSMATIKNCQQKDAASTASSASNIKPRKSSNLLAFVRRSKKKNKKSETSLNPINISSQNLEYIASNSSLGLHPDEFDAGRESVRDFVDNGGDNHLSIKSNEEYLHTTDSEHSVQSTTKTKSHFFRKLIKKQSSENIKKKSDHDLINRSSKGNIIEKTQSCKVYRLHSNKDFTERSILRNNICAPTSFINFGKSTLNVTLANGLQSVQELASRFSESENHLIQILGRYIKDPSCQKELIETLSQHSKLQREAERRTSALANDMWIHQIEIGRAQERTLQETLNTLVKQNRQLQIDNEIMFRKHEKLVRKLRSFPEMGLKYKCMECSSQVECVINHNEKLQEKLDAYVQQIDNLENELHILKKQNDGLEQHLSHSTSQTNILRATIQRCQTEYELDLATLNYELQKKEQLIRESYEAGDGLLVDLDNLKRQFNGLQISLNWSKFEGHGKCVSELLNISRLCINELSKELLSLQTQISIKEKDMETLQETNTKLQENLKKSTTELDNISKKQKCKILESDLKAAQEKIENLKMKFELEKSSILSSVPEYESLAKQISEKDKMIEHTKMFITNITSENLALRNQVDTLNRSLAESGAGDVVKELANCQEQLAYFQSQYYHLLNEKQIYLSDIENLKEGKKSMVLQLETNLKQLRKQLEKKNEENSSLQQQYESEHQTVLTLQHERMKYLEEKNMLKTIFQHMKTEITRVQKLECAVADISKEASKLAVIAEYNKQIGEKLKTEVHVKDQTILQLRSSVEKLNDIQIQNTKEKLSLCYELSEVCQMKEQLNNILSLEMQKNVALDDKKKEIYESASTQLKKYEEIQRNERSALRDLVRDYKILMSQKDNLVNENEKLLSELHDIRNAYEQQVKKCDTIASVKHEKDLQVAKLLAKEKDSVAAVNSLHEKLNVEVNRYEVNTKQLEKLIKQLRNEKEELDNSVKYLQNNTKRLHYDLDESRKREKETKDLLKKAMLERDELQDNITELGEDKEKLISETIFLKQGEIEKLMSEIKELKDMEDKFKNSVKSFENQNQELRDIEYKKQQLENEIRNLRIEHDSSKRLLEDVRREIEFMQKELKHLKEQKEEDYFIYKSHLDEVTRKHEKIMESNEKIICDLKANLKDVSQKLENERSAYATLSEIHKEISGKFLKSVKNFAEEKTARQEVETKLKETMHCLDHMTVEKEDLQNQINILLDGLNDEKNRINTLSQEKSITQGSLDDLQGKYNDLLKKCLTLEHQLRGLELGVSTDSVSDTYLKEHVELLQKESRENHELILELKENITKLQQQITGLEFQKSEMTLRLHETQRRCETEQNLCEQMKNTHKLILAALLRMKDEGKLDSQECNYLLHMLKVKGNDYQ